MTPTELARIQRIVKLRAAQLRMAEATHARDLARVEAARAAEVSAVAAVDDAAEAAAVGDAPGTVVDDLVDARLRVAFLSRVAAQRGREVVAAENTRLASRKRLQSSTITSEQMKTWFDGAARELRQSDEKREDALRDELAARRASNKESP